MRQAKLARPTSSPPERGDIDNETVFDVAPHHAVVGFVIFCAGIISMSETMFFSAQKSSIS